MNSRPEIFADQNGYITGRKKMAVMPFEADTFEIINHNDETVYSGNTAYFGEDKASGDEIWRADFSDFAEKGRYRIRAGGKLSAEFSVSDNVYDNVCRDTLRAFYYLRCGCGLDKEHAGEYAHAPCHTEDAVLWEDHSVKADIKGGWHDAGDYGRYVTPGACALAHLLWGYKLFGDRFADVRTNIPDSCENIPDILTECRVELEWLMKMQRADGGVYHKATTKGHAAFVMPEEDRGQMYLLPVSSSATADMAAICAMASEIYRAFDSDFADKLGNTAQKSYEWLENNPDFLFENQKECTTGSYGEGNDRDNRFWAAAQLYSLTGEEKYHSDMKIYYSENFPRTALSYASTGGFGCLAYIFSSQENKDAALADEMKMHFINRAEELKRFSDECGYGTALRPEEYGWGSNMSVLTRAMIFIIADIISGKDQYADHALMQMDYILGINAMGISYVSGLGEYSVNYLHYRPSSADDIEKCHEGFVSGGPNGRPCDEAAVRLIPDRTPPMKCFADDEMCYSLNEITIYWNSPAVFVAGYFRKDAKKNEG